MKYNNGTFTCDRGTRIYYQSWLPEGDVYGVLLVVHGIAEHSGRYMNVVNHFVNKGYAVYGYDHPGHGKSEGKRVYIRRFNHFISVLKMYTEMVKAWQPDKKIFLVGHSMGGLISTVFLIDYQDFFTGAVLSGSAVKIPASISQGTVLLGKMLSFLAPGAGLVKLDYDGICSDPEVVKAYVDDPLVCKGKTTARLAAEMVWAIEKVGRDSGRIRLPVLIMHGTADKVVDPESSKMLHDSVSSTDKELVLFDGLMHEIFNELKKEDVLQKTDHWIQHRLKGIG